MRPPGNHDGVSRIKQPDGIAHRYANAAKGAHPRTRYAADPEVIPVQIQLGPRQTKYLCGDAEFEQAQMVVGNRHNAVFIIHWRYLTDTGRLRHAQTLIVISIMIAHHTRSLWHENIRRFNFR